MNELRSDIYYIAALTFISCAVIIGDTVGRYLFMANGIFLLISSLLCYYRGKDK